MSGAHAFRWSCRPYSVRRAGCVVVYGKSDEEARGGGSRSPVVPQNTLDSTMQSCEHEGETGFVTNWYPLAAHRSSLEMSCWTDNFLNRLTGQLPL